MNQEKPIIGSQRFAIFMTTLVFFFIFYFGGFYFKEGRQKLGLILTLIFTVLLLALLIFNFVFFKLNVAKQNDLNIQELYRQTFIKKQEIEEDMKAAEITMRRLYLKAVFYVLFIFCVLASLAFSLGLSGKISYFVIIWLLDIVVFYGLLGAVVSISLNKNNLTPMYISRNQFSQIYKLIDQAAKIAGNKRPVCAYVSFNETCVSVEGGTVWIGLGLYSTFILTKAELYSVLLHEFAHVKNKDVKLSAKWASLNNLFTYEGSYLMRPGCLLLRALGFKVVKEYYFYNAISSRYKENLADAAVKKCGNSVDFINATAKVNQLELFSCGSHPELLAEAFGKDKGPQDFPGIFLKHFLAEREKSAPVWDTILRQELPARIDSHPTFRQRMEKMEVYEYEWHEESDEAYRKELKPLFTVFEQTFARNGSDSANIIYAEYLENKDTVEVYEKALSENSPISDDLRREAAAAYVDFDLKKAEELLYEVLQSEPDNAFICLTLGKLLLGRYDEAGFALLYRAIENNCVFVQHALEFIGFYALHMGNEKTVEDLRARQVDIIQNASDRQKALYCLKSSDILSPNDLPKEKLKTIYNRIIKLCDGSLDNVYTIKKTIGGEAFYLFLLEFKEKSINYFGQFADKAFKYLNTLNGRFGMLVINNNAKLKRAIRAQKFNCRIDFSHT